MKNKWIKMSVKERWGILRDVIQILFFLTMPAFFSQAFGGVKEIFTAIGKGEPLGFSSFTMCLLVLCLLTFFFGRVFCGYACAFGAVGDWLYQISRRVQKKTGKKLPVIPYGAVVRLQKVKYAVLALILVLCFVGQSDVVSRYSPWTLFSLMTAGRFPVSAYAVATVLLVLILLGMALHERFFCQFICPMGAVFSLLPQIPFFAMKRNEKNCIPNCQACKRQCPVSVKIGEDMTCEGECIRCGRCIMTCPKGNVSVLNRKKI